jgi:hypothetical protein
LKKILSFTFLFLGITVKAQKIDSIYINLYTDSLKKGTYNYINVDGLLSNGRYLPLDSTHIKFTSSAGKFFGKSLWIENDFNEDRVHIEAVVKDNPLLHKKFTIYIKKKEDDELKSMDKIMKIDDNKPL